MSNESMFPCACCGYLVFDELGSDDICPICWWQDDHSQLRFPEFGGGPNTPSLVEAQKKLPILRRIRQKGQGLRAPAASN